MKISKPFLNRYKTRRSIQFNQLDTILPLLGGEGRGEVELPSNFSSAFPRRITPQRGIMLFECMAYIAIGTIVLALAAAAFIRSWDNSRALKRNAEDIVRALHAGDQWRADLRTATGQIKSVTTNGTEQLLIPSPTGPINYTFSHGELRRQNITLLPNVKFSQMQSTPRTNIHAWRWELELRTTRKDAHVVPLFTFEAVAPK